MQQIKKKNKQKKAIEVYPKVSGIFLNATKICPNVF